MSRNTIYNEIREPMIRIVFNQRGGVEHNQYIPAVITVGCNAITTEGAIMSVSKRYEVGTPQSSPITNKQIYAQINKTTIGGLIAGLFKDTILDAINEDLSL